MIAKASKELFMVGLVLATTATVAGAAPNEAGATASEEKPAPEGQGAQEPGLAITVYEVTGKAATWTRETCSSLSGSVEPLPPSEPTKEEIAARFGGAAAKGVAGTEFYAFGDGTMKLDAALLGADRPIYLGVRGAVVREDPARRTVGVRLQHMRDSLRLVNLDSGLSEGQQLWVSGRPAADRAECVVVRLQAVTRDPLLAAKESFARGESDPEQPRVLRGRVKPPTPITKPDPTYPTAARTDKRAGKVLLEAIVDLDGKVVFARVLRHPPGGGDLAVASLDAVMRWRYKPATLDGEPVRARFTVIITFQL